MSLTVIELTETVLSRAEEFLEKQLENPTEAFKKVYEINPDEVRANVIVSSALVEFANQNGYKLQGINKEFLHRKMFRNRYIHINDTKCFAKFKFAKKINDRTSVFIAKNSVLNLTEKGVNTLIFGLLDLDPRFNVLSLGMCKIDDIPLISVIRYKDEPLFESSDKCFSEDTYKIPVSSLSELEGEF